MVKHFQIQSSFASGSTVPASSRGGQIERRGGAIPLTGAFNNHQPSMRRIDPFHPVPPMHPPPNYSYTASHYNSSRSFAASGSQQQEPAGYWEELAGYHAGSSLRARAFAAERTYPSIREPPPRYGIPEKGVFYPRVEASGYAPTHPYSYRRPHSDVRHGRLPFSMAPADSRRQLQHDSSYYHRHALENREPLQSIGLEKSSKHNQRRALPLQTVVPNRMEMSRGMDDDTKKQSPEPPESVGKEQKPNGISLKFIKSPVTMCFERMLGAGASPRCLFSF